MEKLQQNDKVTFSIRVYNEGTVPAYAEEVIDIIPKDLAFDPESELNKKYGWVMMDENNEVTTDITKARYASTNYLSKATQDEMNAKIREAIANGEEENESGVNNLLLAKVIENGKITIDYRLLEIEFTVKEPISEDRIITNVALTPTYNDDLGIGVTDIDPIEVLEEHIEKIYVKSFDLSLKQVINKIIVTASNGEKLGEFSLENGDDISKLAKIDIPKNKLEGSEVKVEYKITVTNEGETSGYVSEITDHIPEGFIFRLEDNPDWSCADGVYTYNALEDVLLKPEESKEITIVLIWNNIENIGNKANLVEITKHLDENKLAVVDIDSTPGNLVLTEDDIDLTTVIIAVKTG